MGEHKSGHGHHAKMAEDFKRRFWISLIITIPILILSPMIQGFMGVDLRFSGDSYILFALATVIYIYGGKPFLSGAKKELKDKEPAMMTLIGFAITVAYIYSSAVVFVLEGTSFFWELATLIVIMLLGHWIEMRSVMSASKSLDELMKLIPEKAHMIGEDGETRDVEIEDLEKGNKVLVKPGEKIPIDGIIYDGKSSIDESMVTGESVPVKKEKDQEVVGGSINGEGSIKIEVKNTGDDTFLSQVISLVKEAQNSKSKTQRLADKAAKWLFYIAVSAGLITFIAWISITGDLETAVERAVTVIIISCPHALGLAMPLVTSVSTSIGAKRGLLIRDRIAFEGARNIDTIVFDKTGTLTEGEFGVTDIRAEGIKEEELISIAYSLEYNSEHPIAAAIVSKGEDLELKRLEVKDYENITGRGLKAHIDGSEIMIVSPSYLEEENIEYKSDYTKDLSEEGKTVVCVLKDRNTIGYIGLSDIIRDSSKETIEMLNSMDIESIMLTGDNENVGQSVGKDLNMTSVISNLLPKEKSDEIEKLKQKGKRVAMVGDGVNDAPSLAKSDLGIAIGAGTDVAIESADIILVKSDPMDVVNILKLSKATYKKMIQNLIWATAYNVIGLPLAAGVLYNQGIVISPALAAVFMSLSTVIVSINARFLSID